MRGVPTTGVIPFHHVLGVTNGCPRVAERLRRGGHCVVVPEWCDGATFASLDEGLAEPDAVGLENLVARAGEMDCPACNRIEP